MRINAKIDGYDKLINGLRTGESGLRYSLQKSINKIGLILQRDIKSMTPVRTGRLQKGNVLSIGPLTAMISNKVEYGPYVHAKRPFMRWGLDKATPEIQRILEVDIGSALKLITK